MCMTHSISEGSGGSLRPEAQDRQCHILAALVNAGEPILLGDQLLYLGPDDRGIELEIVAVPDDSGRAELTVIHAMPTGLKRRP